jgi:transcriptional regulator with XRE-family HTH domain
MLNDTDSEALVHLALKNLSCSQKELALRLGVSPTQISKWKKGEHMSADMEAKIRAIVDIGDTSPLVVLWSGSLDAANKWTKVIQLLAEFADENSETGYNTEPLRDELDLLCEHTFYTLRKMGVDLPTTFPKELDIDCDDDRFALLDVVDDNPYSSLIYKIFTSFTNVYGFFAGYISELIYDDQLDLFDVGSDIDSCLLELAASKLKIEEVQGIAPKFKEFSYGIRKDYERWLNIVKEKAFRAGVPIRAEPMNLVYESDEALGAEAEAESLGVNASRLHPDIYMDELLRGMRVIHQVLPAIMKKLGMDDFVLDESSLQIN